MSVQVLSLQAEGRWTNKRVRKVADALMADMKSRGWTATDEQMDIPLGVSRGVSVGPVRVVEIYHPIRQCSIIRADLLCEVPE